MTAHDHDNGDIEIKYEAAPGFRPVFFSFLIAATLWLAYIFMASGAGAGH